MAAISKRKKADGSIVYDARITIKQGGEIKHRESKTFNQRSAAQAWAKRRENELQDEMARTGRVTKKLTWAEVAKLHMVHLDDNGRLKRTKRTTIEFLLKRPIAQLDICAIHEKEILAHLRQRIVEDKALPQTVNNDFAYISSVMRHAAAFLDLPVDLSGLELAKAKARANNFVGRPVKRERRLKNMEESALLAYFEANQKKSYMADIIRFALASARRQSEIMNLLWKDLERDTHTITVRDIKHPTVKDFTKKSKLTAQALATIERQPKKDKRIFPRNAKTISAYFTQACKILEIEDLRFHDLRHEATSRLFEAGYSIVEVQQFTLHEDWKTLARYTHLRPEDVKLRE